MGREHGSAEGKGQCEHRMLPLDHLQRCTEIFEQWHVSIVKESARFSSADARVLSNRPRRPEERNGSLQELLWPPCHPACELIAVPAHVAGRQESPFCRRQKAAPKDPRGRWE